MRIRPSVHGFFFKNYLYATAFSAILAVVGIYLLLQTGDFMLSFGLIAIGALIVGIGVVHSKVNSSTTYLELDEKQLVYDTGIISHHRTIAPIKQITDTSMKRSFLERMTGIADLHVNTSGGSGVEIVANDFEYVEVSKMHEKINHMIHLTPKDKEREEPKK